MKFKKQIFGFMDMLRFTKLVPNRRAALAAGSAEPLPPNTAPNTLAHRLHPGRMQVEVTAVRPLTESMTELTFRRLDGDAFPFFRAGQYVSLQGPVEGGLVSRPYSIASSPSRTIAGLRSFPEKVILIAGGYDKKEDYSEFIEVVRKKVKRMVLVGATAPQIEAAAESQGYYSTVRVGDYDEAVKVASECAAPGDVVLLSPACASWDMFDNFEIRGQVFKDLVKRIGSN